MTKKTLPTVWTDGAETTEIPENARETIQHGGFTSQHFCESPPTYVERVQVQVGSELDDVLRDASLIHKVAS